VRVAVAPPVAVAERVPVPVPVPVPVLAVVGEPEVVLDRAPVPVPNEVLVAREVRVAELVRVAAPVSVAEDRAVGVAVWVAVVPPVAGAGRGARGPGGRDARGGAGRVRGRRGGERRGRRLCRRGGGRGGLCWPWAVAGSACAVVASAVRVNVAAGCRWPRRWARSVAACSPGAAASTASTAPILAVCHGIRSRPGRWGPPLASGLRPSEHAEPNRREQTPIKVPPKARPGPARVRLQRRVAVGSPSGAPARAGTRGKAARGPPEPGEDLDLGRAAPSAGRVVPPACVSGVVGAAPRGILVAADSRAGRRGRRRAMATRRVAVMTGGGDCPGLIAVIRAAVQVGCERYGWG
jgi:hypothetical protein